MIPDPDRPWIPSTTQVAPYVRTRLVTLGGVNLENFTTDTRPTLIQAEGVIEDAEDDVLLATGILPEILNDAARSVIILGSAMMVELQYYPEQINTQRSPYVEYKKLYDEKLARLEEAAKEISDDGTIDPGGPGGPGSLRAQFGFDGFAIGGVYW